MSAVIHERWSASPSFAFLCSTTWYTGWTRRVCFCISRLCQISGARCTAAPPCQQDKTAVVKQSKQCPLTAATSPWCDLQTGFLLPSLAILSQAQETHSALPDKNVNQRREKRPSTLGNCSAVFFRAGKPTGLVFSYTVADDGAIRLGTTELHYCPISPFAAILDVSSEVLVCSNTRLLFSHFLMSTDLVKVMNFSVSSTGMEEMKSKRVQQV